MTIQDSIIQALQASHEAHQAGLTALVASQNAHQAALTELDELRTDKASLEARVAELEAAVAYHEAESVKLVDPEVVNPLLEWLSRAVEATRLAIPQSAPATDTNGPVEGAGTTPSADQADPHAATEARPVELPPAEAAPVANQNVPASPEVPAVATAASAPPHLPDPDPAPPVAPHVHPVILQFEDVQPHYPERTPTQERDGDKVG